MAPVNTDRMTTRKRTLSPLVIDEALLARIDRLLPRLMTSPVCPKTATGLPAGSRAELVRLAIQRGLPSLETELDAPVEHIPASVRL
jgi:hypothetical protein